MKAPLVLLLLVSVTLAGCTDGEEAVDDIEQDEVVVLPSLHGWVFDAAVAPVPDVDVEASAGNVTLTATTDADGFYGFDDLPTGTTVVLIARADGFKANAKQTTLAPDATVRMNFTLEAEPVITPYSEVLGPFNGLIACQYTTEVNEQSNNNECGLGNNENEWQMTVGPDFAGGVVEIDWNENTAASTYFRATLECATPAKCGDDIRPFVDIIGPSRLRLEIGTAHAATYFPDGGIILMKVYVDPSNDANEAGIGAAAAVSQPFEAIATMFYHAPPPQGYTIG